MVFSCSSQQIPPIPPYSGMQEGKVSEIGRNPEEHWERSSGGFVDVVYYHDVDNDDDVDTGHDVDNEDYYDHLERRSRGFVAFLRPSVHPIQDEVKFTQFRMTWMSTLRQRSRRCRRSETPTWIILPSQMRFLSQVLWRKVRSKRDTNRLLVNTLFKVNTRKSDNIKVLSWHLQQPESHHIIS